MEEITKTRPYKNRAQGGRALLIKVSDTLSKGKIPRDEKSLQTGLVRYVDRSSKKVPIVKTTKGCLHSSLQNDMNFHIVSQSEK